MESEMIIPEEVNNKNILSEEALYQVFKQLRDELSQDGTKIMTDDIKCMLTEIGKRVVLYSSQYTVCKQQFGQSDELPQDDTTIVIDGIKCRREYYEIYFDYEFLKKPQQATVERVNRVQVNRTNTLPMFYQHLADNPAGKALGFMNFSSALLHSIYHIPGHYHGASLIVMPSVIRYRAQVLTLQSASKLGTQSPLSMGEAFTEFFPQITEIMTIMLCYLLMLWLVCPLDPVLQIILVLMLIAAPCYYIPELVSMVSGIDVTCGFFKVPLIWFTASGALALALIFVFLSLLLIYLIWRFIHPGRGKSETIQR